MFKKRSFNSSKNFYGEGSARRVTINLKDKVRSGFLDISSDNDFKRKLFTGILDSPNFAKINDWTIKSTEEIPKRKIYLCRYDNKKERFLFTAPVKMEYSKEDKCFSDDVVGCKISKDGIPKVDVTLKRLEKYIKDCSEVTVSIKFKSLYFDKNKYGICSYEITNMAFKN